MAQDGAPGPRGRAQTHQRGCARARVWVREGGASTSGRRPALTSRPAPDPTPPSSHLENPEVEEEARQRRWPSCRRWLSRTPERVWGWGWGAGLSGLGNLAWTGRGRPWPRQSCRGSTRSWLRSTRRYPSWAGSRGPPGPAVSGCLGSYLSEPRGTAEGRASAPPFSPPPPPSTITVPPPAAPRRWDRAVSGSVCVSAERSWSLILPSH
jgi:hypothetical protein